MQLDEIAALLDPLMVEGLGGSSSPPEASGPARQELRSPRRQVLDLAYDSRRTAPGSLFFCLRGASDDGHAHAAEAVQAGAVAVVCEEPVPVPVPQLVVADARAAMNRIAAPFFGYPSRHLTLAGVTGTNGKTTIAYMLDAIFTAAGQATGLIGTIETRLPGGSAPGSRTTPESVDLQRLLRRMVDEGVSFCAMEATSIGIRQGRVDGAELAVGIFTNLTQDHLDYHGDLESYYRSKRSLFTPGRAALALVNVDDPYGARLAAELMEENEVPCVTFGLHHQAMVRAVDVAAAAGGSRLRVVGTGVPGRGDLDQPVQTRLPGTFNVSNALAAAAAAAMLGAPGAAISAGLTGLERIPGRFELVDEGQDFLVVVDYAHTPDGLERALGAAAELAGGSGRVIAVFGCGGDRDRGKRALMGRAAAAAAHLVYVTSDNPRSEPPEAIIAEIEAGIAPSPPPLGYHLVVDRAEAIGQAVAAARAGDVVVIAGKGHETTQIFSDRAVDFDDTLVAAAALQRLGGRGRLAASDGSR